MRAAVVKVPDPRGGIKLLRRSIKHLYPIEVSPEEINEVSLKKTPSILTPGTQDNTSASEPFGHVDKLLLLVNKPAGTLEA